jgi:hypothetical protein
MHLVTESPGFHAPATKTGLVVMLTPLPSVAVNARVPDVHESEPFDVVVTKAAKDARQIAVALMMSAIANTMRPPRCFRPVLRCMSCPLDGSCMPDRREPRGLKGRPVAR